MKIDQRFLTFAVSLTLLFTAVPVTGQYDLFIGPEGIIVDTEDNNCPEEGQSEVPPGGVESDDAGNCVNDGDLFDEGIGLPGDAGVDPTSVLGCGGSSAEDNLTLFAGDITSGSNNCDPAVTGGPGVDPTSVLGCEGASAEDNLTLFADDVQNNSGNCAIGGGDDPVCGILETDADASPDCIVEYAEEEIVPESGPDCPGAACVTIPPEVTQLILSTINMVFDELAALDESLFGTGIFSSQDPGPGGDTAPLMPDDGPDDDQEFRIVVPGGTAVLGYQDTDGDGDSDWDELTGCDGSGYIINPFNAKANCDNWDGDPAPNDVDSDPASPASLILDLVSKDSLVAPVSADQIKFTYRCFGDLQNLDINLTGSSAWGVVDGELIPVWDPDLSTGGSGICHEKGNLTFTSDAAFLNTDDYARAANPGNTFDYALGSSHADAGFDFQLEGGAFISNGVSFDVTNAAEEGSWEAFCVSNTTVAPETFLEKQERPTKYKNGYCGNPGETETLNGVIVTYDERGFPDIHPHPGVNVEYDVIWEFTHTSYMPEKQLPAFIQVDTHEGGVLETIYGLLRSPSALEDSANATFTGDLHDDHKYYVGPFKIDRDTSGTPTSRATVVDAGGGITTWGDTWWTCEPLFGPPLYCESPLDDYAAFALPLARKTYANDLPTLVHDNTTRDDVIYDHETSHLTLRLRGHDEGSHGYSNVENGNDDPGRGPGDDLSITLNYFVSEDGSEPRSKGVYSRISDLEATKQVCLPGVVEAYGALDTASLGLGLGGMVESEHRDAGLGACEFWRAEVDDDTGSGARGAVPSGNLFQADLDVPEGSTLYYSFSAEDSEGAIARTDDYVYVIGELPLDKQPGAVADNISAVVDILAIAEEEARAIPNPLDVLTNTDCHPEAENETGCEEGLFGDNGDPFDTDEDGKTTRDPNGQIDALERFVVYYDRDEGPETVTHPHNDRFDGEIGVTAHLGATDPLTSRDQDHVVIRLGDVNATPDLVEAAVVETIGLGVVCVTQDAGEPVQVRGAIARFDPEEGEDACGGTPINYGAPLAYVAIDTDEYFGFIVFTDNDGDGERDGAEGRKTHPLAGSPEDLIGIYFPKSDPTAVSVIDGPRDPIDREIPTTVKNITVSDANIDRYTVSWEAASDDVAVDHYELYTSNATISDLSKATKTNVDGTSHSFTGVEPGSIQYAMVLAVDGKGKESHRSAVQSIDLPDPSIKLSVTDQTLSEDFGKLTYRITVNDLPKEAKKIAIDLEVIDNNEALLDPVVIDVERVELDQASYNAGGLYVNVTLPDDDLGIGDRTYIIRHSVDQSKVGRDLRFDMAKDVDLALSIKEDDVEPAINLANEAGLEIEEGDKDNLTFEVSLSRKPTDDVFIHVTSSNDTRLRLASPHYLLFGIHDWNKPQEVILHAPDNARVDGDKAITLTIAVEPEGSATEFIDRAFTRTVKVDVRDDEKDRDRDGILDSIDKDPNDRFNVDFRPSKFRHQMSADGSAIRFTWAAEHLDERVNRYIIWQFSEPTNVAEIDVVPGQREYNTTINFGGGVHDFALQPVLESDYDGSYDEESAVPLGKKVFTQAYYDSVCGVGNDTKKDSDGDGVCDAFEEEVGTDPKKADSDKDGRDDRQELFVDSTDPSDPDSRYSVIPAWGSNPWMILGTILVLASLALAIASMVRLSRGRSNDAVRS